MSEALTTEQKAIIAEKGIAHLRPGLAPGEIPDKETKNEKIERFLMALYDFRYNEIKQKPEYSHKDKIKFQPVDKYLLNTLKRYIDTCGINTSVDNIKQILASSFSAKINPIQHYFQTLSQVEKNEEDYILLLSSTVDVKNTSPFKFAEYLKKWMVGVVANTLDNEICRNHLCLVLCGDQGTFKTTWLENLCPRELRQYLFTGKIDPTNKDSQTLLAEYLFINIDDQLRQLNKKDENELKNLITVNKVKYRRPYDEYINEYPHLASFMASVNGNEFLTDTTGSRRFLPFEITAIDIKKAQAMNLTNCWRQAFTLYLQKFQYWLNEKEIQELHAQNESFQVINTEEDLIYDHFTVPLSDNEPGVEHMTATAIKAFIERNTLQRISMRKLGEALKKTGFIRHQITKDKMKVWVYDVKKK